MSKHVTAISFSAASPGCSHAPLTNAHSHADLDHGPSVARLAAPASSPQCCCLCDTTASLSAGSPTPSQHRPPDTPPQSLFLTLVFFWAASRWIPSLLHLSNLPPTCNLHGMTRSRRQSEARDNHNNLIEPILFSSCMGSAMAAEPSFLSWLLEGMPGRHACHLDCMPSHIPDLYRTFQHPLRLIYEHAQISRQQSCDCPCSLIHVILFACVSCHAISCSLRSKMLNAHWARGASLHRSVHGVPHAHTALSHKDRSLTFISSCLGER